MAGSFTFFRKYQKSMLVAVAGLAMLAFFVLPPFLQMGSGPASADPVVVSWDGGDLREGELERAVALRTLTNRFLMQAAAAAGRDASQLPAFPEGEELIVREMLLARQAEEIGLTVSNAAINEFLATWTNNMVRQDQFDSIIAGLRYGRAPVAAADLFRSLQTALTARNMLLLFQTGFSGDPPGWSWDFYKRLEQTATVEAYPVLVEDLAVTVEPPNEADLRAFFDRYKDDLPVDRSPNPGFKEPFRIRYAALKAERKRFEDEAAKTITEEDIAAFYEENKETRFRAPTPPPGQAEKPVANQPETASGTPPAGEAAAGEAAEMPARGPEAQPAGKPAAAAQPAMEPAGEASAGGDKPAAAEPTEPAQKKSPEGSQPAEKADPPATPAADTGARLNRVVARAVVFRAAEDATAAEAEADTTPPEKQSGEPADDAVGADTQPAGETEKTPAESAAEPARKSAGGGPEMQADKAAAENSSPSQSRPVAEEKQPDAADTKDGSSGKPASGKKPEGEPAAASAAPDIAVRPLEEVADEIRQQLTRERANAAIDAIFSALAGDLTAYAEDRAVWLARGDEGEPEPVAPDLEKIAEKQGLVAEQSDWISAPAAARAGGIGGSFEFVPDPGSRFGIRQRGWIEMIFAEGSVALRPLTSRDTEGNRYFSWKQDEQEERVPNFAEARETVEKAWRIVQARPLAEKRAADIAAAAGEKGLAETVGEDEAKNVRVVGPFTWLTQGMAGFGAPPALSQPSGLVFPGEALMEAVFRTAASGTASAFNEPQTVCYALRVIALEPDEDELRARFAGSRGEPQRVAMVAQETFADVFRNWLDGLEQAARLTWNREPRPLR